MTKKGLTGARIRSKTLEAKHFRTGTLLKGEDGQPGTPGTPAFDVSSIPSGKTVRGAWGGGFNGSGATGDTAEQMIGFPAPVPVALNDGAVQISTNNASGSTSATIQGAVMDADENGGCTGNLNNPTAPPGKVCLYVRDDGGLPQNIQGNSLHATALTVGGSDADKFGFTVVFRANTNNAHFRADGTWAYTAP